MINSFHSIASAMQHCVNCVNEYLATVNVPPLNNNTYPPVQLSTNLPTANQPIGVGVGVGASGSTHQPHSTNVGVAPHSLHAHQVQATQAANAAKSLHTSLGGGNGTMDPTALAIAAATSAGNTGLASHNAAEQASPEGGKKRGRKPAAKDKKAKDPNAPKRPPSAYILFQNEVRAAIREADPRMAYKDVLNVIAEKWKALDQDQKRVSS